jgi:hypothetical protein
MNQLRRLRTRPTAEIIPLYNGNLQSSGGGIQGNSSTRRTSTDNQKIVHIILVLRKSS